jgi:hypothetical protein
VETPAHAEIRLYVGPRCPAGFSLVTGQPEPDAVGEAGARRAPLRAWVVAHPADVIDVFVYVVVLNLAIQYLPAVISETFTLSLLTAALLKVTLELVLLLKGAVLARLRGATTRLAKATSALMLWVVAAGSKLVVLWLIDIVFGGAVSLGGFIPVTLLVIALLVSRAAVRRLLYGTTAPD